MDMIYEIEDLAPPVPRCLVCEAGLSQSDDKQPLTTPWPHSDSPRQVFAYACRSCMEQRRDDVTVSAQALFQALVHEKMKITGFLLNDVSYTFA